MTANSRAVLTARSTLLPLIGELAPLYTRISLINTALNDPSGGGIDELADALATVARFTSELETAQDENAPADAPHVGHLRERQRGLAADLAAAQRAVAESNVWDQEADRKFVLQLTMLVPPAPAADASEAKRGKYELTRQTVMRHRAEAGIDHDHPLTWRELRVAIVRLLVRTFSEKAAVAALLTYTFSEAGNGRLDDRNVSALKGCQPEMNEISEDVLDEVKRYTALQADINDAIATLTAGQGARVDEIRAEQSQVLADIEAVVEDLERQLGVATKTAEGIADGLRKERTKLLGDAHPFQEGVDESRAVLSSDEFDSIIATAGLTDDVRRMILRESDGD